jgi:ribosomal protein L14E/L6E/L27E
MFFFVWFLVPETKGLSLERMDDLFGLTEMVKNIEADRENHAHNTATELDMDGKNMTREERKEVVN